jgi:hypothetical protein
MIERLLAADRALEAGDVDLAARLFGQVAEADPRNAIAVVGQARIALVRGASDEARRLSNDALAIDPDDAAARRLLDELDAPPPEPAAPAEAAARAEPGEPAEPEPPRTGRPRSGLAAWLRRLFGRRA